MDQSSPQSSWSTTMARLSSKAGVVATVVIDSSLGSVIQTSGHYSISHSKSSQSANSARPATENGLGQLATGSSDLEELAAMVWKYVKSTEALIADIDSEDEIKLLRLRTRKHELVIAPDPKYILVVVHEISGV
ncbi:hypothetical protein M430DRAFT_40706 [Amorphotheca resinae ATCC 22711]|uniref:Roadblock/LAMTOR2 domain-containing protein n=1 Tax=Amorphotheca resinae ATCC 22711 TaxID=857342 RepID=A0A2T3B568_AMORE|nr:hypothetical protein M430DRAFT_40706 [Amorphotheca resinae ATCC 22711]PSS21897.1 hypothetical protein M430DRAFT_40706 [Amorphotheca resinae ATCC 22711]